MRLFPALLLVVGAAAAHAQGRDKARLLADWTRDRKNVLAYIDAMPDSAITFMPTPGVRNFAQQIDHFVGTNVEVAAMAVKGLKEAPPQGDSAKYLHQRAALHSYAAASYDFVLAAIKDATPAQLDRPSSMYKQPNEPAWRWLDLSREHTSWTLGQTVPYLRLNKVTPPAYDLPF